MPNHLKLVTRYDAGRNQYTVFRHNLGPEEVGEAVRELSAKLFGLFVIDQHGKHAAGDAELCDACRREVETQFAPTTKPQFTRRHE